MKMKAISFISSKRKLAEEATSVDRMNNLFETIEPLCWILKCCGFLSYTKENRLGWTYLKLYKGHFMVSLILQIVLFGIAAQVAYEQNIEDFNLPLIELVAQTMYGILEMFQLFFNTVAAKIGEKKLLGILNTINDMELKMGEIKADITCTFLKRFMRCFMLLWLLVLCYFIWMTLEVVIWERSIEDFFRNVLYVYSFVSEQMSMTKYFALLLIIRHILLRLNSRVSQLISQDQANTDRILRKVAEICQEFFELVVDINSYFFFIILLQLGSIFAFIVVQISVCTNALTSLNANQLGEEKIQKVLKIYISAITYCAVMLLIYTITTELYVKEVVKLKTNLCRVMNRTEDQQVRNEINTISLQISHENYQITAAGFFVVDMKLIFTILAAIGTYTVVLIQFDPQAGVYRNYMEETI